MRKPKYNNSINIIYWLVLYTFLFGCMSIQNESRLLYANKAWYKDATVKEEVFVGILVKNIEALGPFSRQSSFSLKTKEETYKLYDPEQLISSRLTNTKIRIKGKLIKDNLSNILNEIWPGIIE